MSGRFSTAMLVAACATLATAGAGQIVNGDFEGGFSSSGLANGWTLFSSSGYTVYPRQEISNVHGGWRAQKIEMPQPGSQGYGGIFQTIDTVSGQVYRITFWFYASTISGESYPGEDFVPSMGFDTAGRNYYDQDLSDFEMSWLEFDPGRGVWRQHQREFIAGGPRTTIFLRGWRKWAQHGSSYFIIDDVSIQTVSETHPPSYGAVAEPEDPPLSGGNLLTNPDFDSRSFVGGVGGGWTRWTKRGTASYRPTRNLGKLGGGHYNPSGGSVFQAISATAKVAFAMDPSLGALTDVKNNGPETVTIGRLAGAEDVDFWSQDDAETIALGRAHAEACYQKHLDHPGIDAWQGYNEPWVGSRQRVRKVVLFEKAFTERCHELGIRSIVLNLGVGNPDTPGIAEMFKDLFAIADFVGYHAYGEPGLDLMNGPNEAYYAHRWRMMKARYDERGWRHPPVIYTESGTYGPWKGRYSTTTIADDYEAATLKMMDDDWLLGHTVFCVGGFGFWDEWDIADDSIFQQRFTAWNVAHTWEARSGRAQEWYYSGSNYRGGIVQTVSTGSGDFWLSGWFKYETGIGGDPTDPEMRFRIGYDRTGQRTNADASTVLWSEDQIHARHLEAFVWYRFALPVRSTGSQVSIWFETDQASTTPDGRFYLDDLSLRAADLPPFCDVEFH